MKICVISDIHGSSKWKDILSKEKLHVDKFIFLGDYFDSKGHIRTSEEEFLNFQEIVAYKNLHQNIDLLIGNHDIQYLGSSRTSSFQRSTHLLIHDYLQLMVEQEVLKVAVCYDSYLFSHAGISNEWLRYKGYSSWEEANLHIKYNPKSIAFVSSPLANPTGDDPFQSPVWIRPYSLLLAAVPGYHQVVGHTRLKKMRIQEQCGLRYFFTDTTLLEYLVLDTETGMYKIMSVC